MTSTFVDTGTRTCEHCGDDFTRRRRAESVGRFLERRYCGNTCATTARRQTPTPPASPDLTPARVVNGVWRPNAPGWPDTPGGRP